jgi:protein-tyrosine phosphatase
VIDLHCHMLPGLDDGATDLETAIEMARIAVADGISVTACTPHILPGVYQNTAEQIKAAIADLAAEFAGAGIPLRLVIGADIHVVTDLLSGLKSGRLPTLNGSRYFLLEPPHHVMPPRFEELVFSIHMAGYVPIITHPERLSWIKPSFALFKQMVKSGIWMQLTAGSLFGKFGRDAQYWSERMVGEGLVHILATDAHGVQSRRPTLNRAREFVAKQVGEAEATHLVLTRPQAVLENVDPSRVPPPVSVGGPSRSYRRSWPRLFSGA